VDAPLEFEPSDSGEPENPVIYAAAAGERAVFSGGRLLKEGHSEQINDRKAWSLDVPEVKRGEWRFRQLFINGERRPRTRLPKKGEYQIESLPGYTGDFLRNPTKQFVYRAGEIESQCRLPDGEENRVGLSGPACDQCAGSGSFYQAPSVSQRLGRHFEGLAANEEPYCL
jgi:hypothetical protein